MKKKVNEENYYSQKLGRQQGQDYEQASVQYMTETENERKKSSKQDRCQQSLSSQQTGQLVPRHTPALHGAEAP